MRASYGARKINSHGGETFIHEDRREDRPIDFRVVAELPQLPMAPFEIRFRFRLADLPRDARIVIVEGVLKADVLSAIRPELYIVATPCVTANHGALVELTRGRPMLMAFDQDLYSNETVCFHLAALVAGRLRRERTLAPTRLASWDAKVKGIDDAAVRNLPITSIGLQQWLDRLSPRFRQIAMARLSKITAPPPSAKNRSGSQRRRRR
jgi:hypothetical protein